MKDRCVELQGELSVQSDGNDIISVDFKSRLGRVEDELRTAKIDLAETRQSFEEARNTISSLTEELETAENKYTHEMMLHSKDLQVKLFDISLFAVFYGKYN